MIAFASVFLLVSLGVSYSMFNDRITQNNEETIKDYGYSLQNEIILASEVYEGYSREINIPNKISNIPYNIYNSQTYFTLNYSGGAVSFQVPSMTGTLAKGVNTIKNMGGDIEVN